MSEKPQHPGMANLKPFASAEVARELGRKGGTIAGRRRTEAKTLREQLKAMLSTAIPKDSPIYAKLKAQKKSLGLNGVLRVGDMPLIGLINKAAKGSPEAFAVMRDTMGEKPKEVVEQSVSAPPVVLGVFSPDRIAAEKAKQEAAVAAMRKADTTSVEVAPGAPEAVSAPDTQESAETSAPTGEPLPPDPPNGPTVPPSPAPQAAVKPMFFAPRR